MPLSQDLLAAYENADYVVFADPELVLRIGEPSARLDALLEHEGASTAAYITAENPRGEHRLPADNASAVATLAELVAAAGYPSYPGEGRDPDGERDAEHSLLVIGIYRANAEELGRLFGQNAIVFVEKGAAPELVVLS
jgi:hypothetical protein